MQVTSVTPVTTITHAPPLPATAPAPTQPITVIDHDGTRYEAPCMQRYCPPDHHVAPGGPLAPPVLVDHDGNPFPPPHGGHGRA